MKNILMIFGLLVLLSGCVASGGKRGNVYQLETNREDFSKRASQFVKFPANVQDIAIQVAQVPSIVQIQIPLNEEEEILQLRLREGERFNIDRTLLTGRTTDDFLIDTDNNMLLLNLDLPAIYFLSTPLRYEIQVQSSPTNRSAWKLKERQIHVALNWVPARSKIQGESGFEYYPSLKKSEEHTETMVPKMIQEMTKSNQDRFNSGELYRLQQYLSK